MYGSVLMNERELHRGMWFETPSDWADRTSDPRWGDFKDSVKNFCVLFRSPPMR
jgi:hypothetical protein